MAIPPLTVQGDVDSLLFGCSVFWKALLSAGGAVWHTAIDSELEFALKSQCNHALSAACCSTVLQELKKDSSGPVKKTTELLKQQPSGVQKDCGNQGQKLMAMICPLH